MKALLSESLVFAPLLPWPLLAGAGLLAAGLLVLAARQGLRGTAWRAVAGMGLFLALLDPRLLRETREARPDVALVMVDDSPSQAARREATEAALREVEARLGRLPDLEVRILRSDGGGEGTRLFRPLAEALASIPPGRFAGAVLITDGQVHDRPEAPLPGPLQVLLTGRPGEIDRRLVLEQAPAYGIVGGEVAIRFRVDEAGAKERSDQPVQVRVSSEGRPAGVMTVRVGEAARFVLPVEHAGPTVAELEVEALPGEASARNNRAAVAVNGVRDRLKVLLVSGQPHPGERTWRNLLKSDPQVDLVHFTILRPPHKQEFTPVDELALIAFPVRELFENRLKDFHLVVFDRYVLRQVMTYDHLVNLVAFVRGGGAVLAAVGPEYAGPESLANSLLKEILPALPKGGAPAGGFRPAPTDLGRRHPVTALPGAETWGRWLRHVPALPEGDAQVLLQGPDSDPLLVLAHLDKGRTAILLSDHVWLWARGFEGGGPHGELMRRLTHWLMKEPDLEEEALAARVEKGRLLVERRSLGEGVAAVVVTLPSGETRELPLGKPDGGRASAAMAADQPGLYRIGDGEKTAFAASGIVNSLEDADLRATDERLRPLAAGVAWAAEGIPAFSRVVPGREAAGRGWMGLVRNRAEVVTGMRQVPLLPGLMLLALVLLPLAAAWRREGR
ncbi:MAG: hypothetical protein H7841_16405 [Magnetospirillum sp. WYHS-4]